MSEPAVVIPVEEPTQVGAARRAARALAETVDGVDEGLCALVATELATNLARHARRGMLVVQPAERALAFLSLDRGPGIANIAACMRDGYSGGSSPGTGLGAVRRSSSVFDAYSVPGEGTAIVAIVRAPDDRPARLARTDHAGLTVPLDGQSRCGDAWSVVEDRGVTWALLVDGLGHGPQAAEAAAEAVAVFGPASGPKAAVERIHDALRATRGAAVGVAAVDAERATVCFAGAGNVAAAVVRPGGHAQRLASHNGTAGIRIGNVAEFTAPWTDDSSLVLHSDGLRTSWGPEDFPGLFTRHPGLIAGLLYRDLARGTDDAGVLVVRERRP